MNLLIADDHTLFRDALCYYIRRERPSITIRAVSDLYEAESCLNEQKNDPFDIIILDLLMPGMNGMQGLLRIKETYPDTPLLLMSGVATPEDVRQAMAFGCAGYFPKTLSCQGLLEGLDVILKGEKYVPVNLETGRILESFRPMEKKCNEEDVQDIHDRWVKFRESSVQEKKKRISDVQDHEEIKLTKREQEVLSYLMKGYKNKDIADVLGIKTVTIKLHVRSICRKLKVKNRTQAALRATELNLMEKSYV